MQTSSSLATPKRVTISCTGLVSSGTIPFQKSRLKEFIEMMDSDDLSDYGEPENPKRSDVSARGVGRILQVCPHR
jgi:hypothetical protein